MNKSQIALLSGAGILLLALLVFGKTHLPSKNNTPSTNASAAHDHSADAAGLLESAHKILTPLQQKSVELIENQLKKE